MIRLGRGRAHLIIVAVCLAALLAASPAGLPAGAQPAFANPAFERVWEHTDRPVASGQAQRSWFWGPTPNSGPVQEEYLEGASGTRLVQYFDKSRMEINNPSGNPNDPFFVTNGLLTVELISGYVQVGNSAYKGRWPADIPLASDPDDVNAPTYFSFQPVSNTPLGDHPADGRVGQPATATIARNGSLGDDQTKVLYPKINIAYFEPATRHNIPQAIWDFLNESGPVYDPASKQTSNARLSDPWFYATGFPISEAYWARVKVAGQQQDVLIQAFERRVVTYTPNGVPGFKVQMGNIGQHYYDWRYKDAGKPAEGLITPTPPRSPATATPPPAASPTPTSPAAQPTPVPTTGPSSDCSDIPTSQNATITPSCFRPGASFQVTGRGFQPGENVAIYATAPDQAVLDLSQLSANDAGVVSFGLRTSPQIELGIWAVTMEGVSSHSKAIGYFKVIP